MNEKIYSYHSSPESFLISCRTISTVHNEKQLCWRDSRKQSEARVWSLWPCHTKSYKLKRITRVTFTNTLWWLAQATDSLWFIKLILPPLQVEKGLPARKDASVGKFSSEERRLSHVLGRIVVPLLSMFGLSINCLWKYLQRNKDLNEINLSKLCHFFSQCRCFFLVV